MRVDHCMHQELILVNKQSGPAALWISHLVSNLFSRPCMMALLLLLQILMVYTVASHEW